MFNPWRRVRFGVVLAVWNFLEGVIIILYTPESLFSCLEVPCWFGHNWAACCGWLTSFCGVILTYYLSTMAAILSLLERVGKG